MKLSEESSENMFSILQSNSRPVNKNFESLIFFYEIKYDFIVIILTMAQLKDGSANENSK